MSSFRSNGNHHPSAPPRRHRRNSIQGLITNNRPRSIAGLYSSNGSNPYSSTYSSRIPASTYGTTSIPSYSNGYSSPYMNYNSYSSPYNSANSSSYYGLTSPSYNSKSASISSMLNSLNLSKPLSSYAVVPSIKTTSNGNKDNTTTPINTTRQSRAKSRHDKYNRDRSLSRASSNIDSKSSDLGGSRSISLTSLESQGYVSGSEQQGNNNKESRLSASRGELIVTRNENGEVDYKKLWEQAQADNDRLRDKLRKQDEELRDTKLTLEKISTVTSKNSLSELEKRERRAMERKLSEMEEELKQLQKLKAENERLRAENRALTRVVSKLTNTTGK